jgi:hypothetical protein
MAFQLRNLIKLVGSLITNTTLGNQTTTDVQMKKLYDDQLYSNTNSKSIFVDTAYATLATPAAWQPTDLDSTNYQALSGDELAAIIDHNYDNAAYGLRTALKKGTGYEFTFPTPIAATSINAHVKSKTWSNSTAGNIDKCLFDSSAASNASLQASQATKLFWDTPSDWYPENLGTTSTLNDWVWKDAGRKVALNGFEIQCQFAIGIRICYWTGSSNPTSGQLDGDAGWTDIPLKDTVKFSTGDYYHMPGKTIYANHRHHCTFQYSVRARYWKIYFLWYNKELWHDLPPYFRLSKQENQRTDETQDQTIMWNDPNFIISNKGYRLRSIITQGGFFQLGDYTYYSVNQFKMGRMVGTYDWYIENVGGTVNIGPTQGARPYGYNIKELRKYDIGPKFIPNDAYTWYLGLYSTTPNGLYRIQEAVGTRQIKSGNLTGTCLAFTPQSYTPLLSMIYLPPLCVNSIRGISAAGLSISYRDVSTQQWTNVPLESEPQTIYSKTYPIESFDTDNIGVWNQGKSNYKLMWNAIAVGMTDLPNNIIPTDDFKNVAFQKMWSKNNKLFRWGGLKNIDQAASFPTLLSAVYTDYNNYSGYSFRVVIKGSDIKRCGDRIRLGINSRSNVSYTIDHASIVERSGDTANGTTTPTNLTFGGSASINTNSYVGKFIYTDWIYYKIDRAKDYLLIVDINSAVNQNIKGDPNLNDVAYYKAATASYNQQNVSGFSVLAYKVFLRSIDVEVGYDSTNTLDVYDIDTKSWSQLPNGGTGRYGASSVIYGSDVVIWGGFSSLLSTTKPTPIVQWNDILLSGSNTSDNANYSFRQVIPSSEIKNVGGYIRVSFCAGTAQGFKVDKVSIGERSGSTANTVSTPVEIKFNSGQSGFNISANATITSDWLQFPISLGKDYIITFDMSSTSAYEKYLGSKGTCYYKTSTDSWNVATVSGFTSETSRRGIYKIEVDGEYICNTGDVLNLDSTSWSTITTGGTARMLHSAVVYNGKMYAWGGITDSGVVNTMDIYDFATHGWTTGTAGGTARYGHTAVVSGTKMICWGGVNSINNGSLLNTVDIYDFVSNTWTTGLAGGTARYLHTAHLYNGSIYYIDGFGLTASVGLALIDIYNISNNTWSTNSLPYARIGQSSCLLDNVIWFHGNALGISDLNNITLPGCGDSRYVCTELYSKNATQKIGVYELEFNIAASSIYGDNSINIGITANDSVPNRSKQGYRNRNGIFFRFGSRKQMSINVADGSGETVVVDNKQSMISSRRIDSLADENTQYYSKVRIRVNFTTKTYSLKVDDTLVYQGVYTNAIDTAMGSSIIWSLSYCGDIFIQDGMGTSNIYYAPAHAAATDYNAPTGIAISTYPATGWDAAVPYWRAFSKLLSDTSYGWKHDDPTPESPKCLMISFTTPIYTNRFKLIARNTNEIYEGWPRIFHLQCPAPGIISPDISNDAHWVTVSRTPGTIPWPVQASSGYMYGTSDIPYIYPNSVNALRLKVNDHFTSVQYVSIGQLMIQASMPITYVDCTDVNESLISIRSLKVKWTGTNDENWLISSDLMIENKVDSANYTVKAQNFRFTECDPRYRQSFGCKGEGASYQDGYSAIAKGKVPQNYLDVVKLDDLDNYIINQPEQDFVLAAHLSSVELISGTYMMALEQKHLPSKFEMWLYGAESTDVYWSDARTWSGIQTRYGDGFAGQWGYISFWERLGEPKYHGGFLGYGPFDKQFMYPFYKFSTSWDYKTNPSGIHGWSYIEKSVGTKNTIQSNYNNSGCLAMDVDRSDTSFTRPRGLFFTRTKPDFTNGEILHIGFRFNCDWSQVNGIGGAGIGWFDNNNDYRSVTFSFDRYTGATSNNRSMILYHSASASRSVGDNSVNERTQNVKALYVHGTPGVPDGSVLTGGWISQSLRWEGSTVLNGYMNISSSGKAEWVRNDWNSWNVLPYFGSDLRVGIFGMNYICPISSFYMLEGWEIPGAWPLTEFRAYNSVKSIGIAGNWGNNKTFTFQFGDISTGQYYLWAYIAGIQSTGDTEIGTFSIQGRVGSYTINSSSPYNGKWVQIGTQTFDLSSSDTLNFAPTNTYGKNSWTKTTAIKGICAKKTAGEPSSYWIPRGYLGTAERCRAAYNNPEVAKVSDVNIINQHIGATSRLGSAPNTIKIKPSVPRYAKLIEVASRVENSTKSTHGSTVYKHTFNYNYDFLNRHTIGIPWNGMHIENEDYVWQKCYCTPTDNLQFHAWIADTNASAVNSGIYSEPFYFGPGFWVEAKLYITPTMLAYNSIIYAPILMVQSASTCYVTGQQRRGLGPRLRIGTSALQVDECRLYTYKYGFLGDVSHSYMTPGTVNTPYRLRINWDGTHAKSGWNTAWCMDEWDEWAQASIFPNNDTMVEDLSNNIPIMVGLTNPLINVNNYVSFRCEWIKIYPGVGGTVPIGFDNQHSMNDFVIHGFTPIKASFLSGIDKMRVSHYADTMWFDTTDPDINIIGKEIEVGYTNVPTLVLDYTGDDSYYINSVTYYTDDANAINNVTIDVGQTFDSTAMTRLSLQAVTEGVSANTVPASKCFRVTHSLGRYDAVVVHVRQMIVEFRHEQIDWGIDGSQQSAQLKIAPMGDYSEPTLCYIYNDMEVPNSAQVCVPNNDYGLYVQVSSDGANWVGQGGNVTVADIPAKTAKSFYIRTYVPLDYGTPGTQINRLIFARWLG